MATFLLLLPANLLPVMTLRIAGTTRSTHLASGLMIAWQQGWPLVAVVLGLVAIALPFVRFGMLTGTLAAIRFGVRGRWMGRAFRYCELMDEWAMSDVLLVGAGIGYGRVASQVPLRIDVGGWCFVAAAVMTMLTRASLERRAVWRRLGMPPADAGPNALACISCDLVLPPEAEGRRCPRCSAPVHRRRPFSLLYTTALTLATLLVTPLAYAYPMSQYWVAGTPHPHTITAGIVLLFQSPFWYFGIVITLVSVIFPLTKLISLTWCLVSIHRHSSAWLRGKTKLHRFVDQVGRWSVLDPFAVIIFAPLVQFGQLAYIEVMGGCEAFLATVVLSMIAASVFDPRLMWDAPGTEPETTVVSATTARSSRT